MNAINCSEILRQCPYEMSLTGQCWPANFHLWRANLTPKNDQEFTSHFSFTVVLGCLVYVLPS